MTARVKGDKLGEFEEFTLLALCALGEEAYGVPVQQFVERATRRNVSMGAVYAALVRLEGKGLVRSLMSEALARRGGKPRRVYRVTPLGLKAVRDLRRVREQIWSTIEAERRS